MPGHSAELITDHYQNTFELTHESWKERNKLFIYLVIITGIGLLLLLQIPEAKSLFVDLVVKLLEITDEGRKTDLHQDFPLDIILSIILVIVFYLMQKLYSTNLAIFRHYLYLGEMEDEIREKLGLKENDVSFTREGKFYWDQRTLTQKLSKWYYIFVISIILLPFIVLKIRNDFHIQNYVLAIVDCVVAAMTLFYYGAYIYSATRFDVKKIPSTSDSEKNQ